jgi:hypothetical protein
MSETTMRFVLAATGDQAEKVLDSFGEKMGEVTKGFVKNGLEIAGAFAVFDAAKDFLGESVKTAEAGELAQAKLATAVKNAGFQMKAYAPQVEEADAAMRKYGFTNAETKEALATLTIGLKDPAKALSVLGVAADLATAKGLDLNAASLLVTKGMEGQVRPLKALGIDIPVYAGNAQSVAIAQQAVAKAQEKVNELMGKAPAVVTKAGTSAATMASHAATLARTQEAVVIAQERVSNILAKSPSAASSASSAHASYTKALSSLQVAQNGVSAAEGQIAAQHGATTSSAAGTAAAHAKLAAAEAELTAAQDKLSAKQSSGQTILDAISSRLKGSAAAAAETYAGKVKAITAEWDDVQEKAGTVLLPVLGEVVDWLSKTGVPALQHFAEGWDHTAGAMGNVATIAHAMHDDLDTWFKFWDGVGQGIGASSPFASQQAGKMSAQNTKDNATYLRNLKNEKAAAAYATSVIPSIQQISGATKYQIPNNAAGGTYGPVAGGHIVRLAEAGRSETIVDTASLNRAVKGRGSGGINIGQIVMQKEHSVAEYAQQLGWYGRAFT